MWLITTIGFFSAVQKPGDTELTVRARARADLDRLREQYLPELGETIEGAGTDYAYRAKVSHEAFARASAAMVSDIDYGNFKNEVARTSGRDRATVYGGVWVELLALQQAERG